MATAPTTEGALKVVPDVTNWPQARPPVNGPELAVGVTADIMYPQTFRAFRSTQEARDYRHANNLGGWIYVPNNLAPLLLDRYAQPVILFPPSMSPHAISKHPWVSGRPGRLLAP